MCFTCLAAVSLAARIFTFRCSCTNAALGTAQHSTAQHNVACHMQNTATEMVADYYFAIIVIVNNNFDLIRLDWQTLESATGEGRDVARLNSSQDNSCCNLFNLKLPQRVFVCVWVCFKACLLSSACKFAWPVETF